MIKCFRHIRLLIFVVVLFQFVPLTAQINYENTIRLTDGWLFLREDVGNIWETVRPAKPGSPEEVPIWQEVQLPHCFNAEDAVDPDVNYYQGPGWYKTLLSIDNPYADGRTLLHFEGAGQKTEVYVYTEKVGVHIGGYDEWTVDITDAIDRFLKHNDSQRFKGKIPLSIRSDNSRDAEMIPSDLSDFNLYGGIYRYLNLVYTPALSLKNIYINPSVDAQGKKADLAVRVDFEKHAIINKANVKIKITDPHGKIVVEQSQNLTDFTSAEVLQKNFTKPVLWSTETPHLYSCEITLSSEAGSATYHDKFGFRHFEFIEKGPFKLNGKRLLLRGTHRHEDHAGLGAAMTEDLIIQELELMKEMGVNFIRLGHYQQSRVVLEQCDRLGFLVWEEIPWCRGGLGGEAYKQQAKNMVTNMITQHRNHPSIILWGLGNENDWPNDFPEFDKKAIQIFMKELHDLSHQLDDSRLTSIRRCDFCKDIVDVYSPSIWAGWYRGVYTDYKTVSYNEMQRVNHFLHVEWGGDSHARRFAEDVYENLRDVKANAQHADERDGDASLYGGMARASKNGDWSESYICDLIDWHLKEQETMDWLTGTAYWPFKDFSTPVRPENPVPYMNQKGVIERDFTKKEAYYLFQSYWTDKPMVRIFGHEWLTRWGKADEKKIIKVYSNCEKVELFLNGVSLGVKTRNSQDFPAAGLRWETELQAGKNTLKAIGIQGKGKKQLICEDEHSFEYETRLFGAPSSISVNVEDTDEAGFVWIKSELMDKNGVVSLDSRDEIRFESVGYGELIVNQGTSTGAKAVQAYNGRARIKLKKNNGKTVVAVSSKGLETVFIEVK